MATPDEEALATAADEARLGAIENRLAALEALSERVAAQERKLAKLVDVAGQALGYPFRATAKKILEAP